MSKPIEALTMTREKLPFTEALLSGAMALRTTYLTFTIELAASDFDQQPRVIASAPTSGTIGEYLANIFRQAPLYQYEELSEHTIAVYPRGAKEDPTGLLNLRISQFDGDDIYAGTLMSLPDMFVPELAAKLFPPTPGKPHHIRYSSLSPLGPKVTLHLRNVTLHEILKRRRRSHGKTQNRYRRCRSLRLAMPHRAWNVGNGLKKPHF